MVGCFLPSDDCTFARPKHRRTSWSKEAVIKRAPVAGWLILTCIAACDNVSWGGADITIVPPPPKASGRPEPGSEPGAERLPEGPILYHVVAANGASITPVTEISGDSLLPLQARVNPLAYAEALIAEHLRQGSEFVLFRDGVRAGTFIAQSASVDESGCRPTARAAGALELGSLGEGVQEFLAIAKVQAPQIQRRTTEALVPTRTMRVLAPILADAVLRARNSPLPSDWERAMARLRPFSVPGARDPAFAATFLVGDTLGPGLDDDGQSVFFVAMPGQLGYDTVYVRFSDYAADGKSAPEVIDFLDWNRDDSPDLLLRVFGIDDVWYEAVGRAPGGEWRTLFSDRCDRTPVPPPDTSVVDTMTAVTR